MIQLEIGSPIRWLAVSSCEWRLPAWHLRPAPDELASSGRTFKVKERISDGIQHDCE
jgi:hypothetical protein